MKRLWCRTHFQPAHAYAHDSTGWVGYACHAWIHLPHLLERCEVSE